MGTNQHKLEDRIVSDALIATTMLTPEIERFVGGGMAVQAYISNKSLHRTTGDLDLTISKRFSYREFKEYAIPMVEKLNSFGYKTEIKDERQTYDVKMTSQKGDRLKIQFPRRSPKSFCEYAERTSREVKNAIERDYNVGGINGDEKIKLKTMKPEDIILRKLSRILVFEREYNISPVPRQKISYGQLEHLNGLKEAFDPLDANPTDVANIRLQADLFDINILLDSGNFNKKYFESGFGLYPILAKDGARAKDIARAIHWKFS